MPIRTVEEFSTQKTYATASNAADAAHKATEGIPRMCNVTIFPVVNVKGYPAGTVRYAPVFSCFEWAQDAVSLAHAGFTCFR